MFGVFMVFDFFVWFIFWEVVFLLMYFFIGVWGGLCCKYVVIKFFVYMNIVLFVMFIGFILFVFGFGDFILLFCLFEIV